MSILAIDVGSSSVRALLYDGGAVPIVDAVSTQAHQFFTRPDGESTADADLLAEAVERCIDGILRHPAADTIQAVGMATFVTSLVGVDGDGNALTPLYTYADTRCADDVRLLKQRLDEGAVYRATGCPQHTAYYPAKLHWLKRTQPELFASTHQWLDMGVYLYRRWFGRNMPMSLSSASWTGLLNLAGELNAGDYKWARDVLESAGLQKVMLPPLADYDTIQTHLSSLYAVRWRRLKDVPFYLPVGDGAAANLGSGAVQPDQLALTVGTTAAVRKILPFDKVTYATIMNEQDASNRPWVYRLNQQAMLAGGATYEGGNIFQWARKTLNLSAKDVEAELLNRPADCHHLIFLPHLSGERSPGWQSQATGILHGLRLSTSPLDILQAALEGVAQRLSIIADSLGEGIVMAGGGALMASPAWSQIIANAMNRRLHLIDSTEVTARGVALMVLREHAGLSWDTPPPIRAVIDPQPQQAEILQAARRRHIELYQQQYHPSSG